MELLNLMEMMFLMMMAGYLLRRFELVSVEGKKSLTNLILYVVLPCNIVRAFCMETGEGFWQKMSAALIVAVLVQVLSMLIARFAYQRMPREEKQVFQYATVCSNAGFMGNPLAEGIFGDIGLLYASVFLIPLRIVMWTAGVSYFTDDSDYRSVIRKVLVHPCMIAVYIGMTLMLTGLRFPTVIDQTVRSFGGCCTGLTMLYIGMILVGIDWKTLCSLSQIYFAVIRLLLIPVIVLLGCLAAGVDGTITGVSVLLSAMPAGSTTSILASKYGADEGAAAKCVVFTTLLSVIAIPVWSTFLLWLT